MDIGGIHGRQAKSVTLDNATATTLGLTAGGVYEIVIFQAERNTCQSNYWLTLDKFVPARSVCESFCGNAIRTPDEACDLGTANNKGAYGTCNADCTLPIRCGDSLVQGANGEDCDNGTNLDTYGWNSVAATPKCGPGCKYTPYCGDSSLDSPYEQCDQGGANVDATVGSAQAYGKCTTTCELGGSCGDGITSGPEECDDGINNGSVASACDVDCTFKCGNGHLDAGEQCDDGINNADNVYDACSTKCSLGPRCGDGVVQASEGEACDDGLNDGSYGTCGVGCVAPPYCGDKHQDPSEQCDLGGSNQSPAQAYGVGTCTTTCAAGGYCGNGRVEANHGEQCDGVAGCNASCKWITSSSCGNGVKDANEQCDNGANNGSGSNCDTNCHLWCGNGVVDTGRGETCDDGVNNGTYGGCSATCGFAGYCGDETVNGPEECDLGQSGNQTAPYGVGTCTKGCKNGPFCGDGRIQSPQEECDGAPGCNASCKWGIVIK